MFLSAALVQILHKKWARAELSIPPWLSDNSGLVLTSAIGYAPNSRQLNIIINFNRLTIAI